MTAPDTIRQVSRPFTTIAALVFALVALVHAWRFVAGWEVVVAGYQVPHRASALAAVVAGGLALMVWRERRA